MAAHIRKDDVVEVISGEHKGARGKVLRVDLDRHLVYVEGVNKVYRHVRPSRKNPQGGRLQKEAPLHLSNVLPYDTAAGKGRRVRFDTKVDAGGKVTEKKRVTTAGTVLGTLVRGKGA